MVSFTKELTITKIKIKKRKFWRLWSKNKYTHVYVWRVERAFSYHAGEKEDMEVIFIPKGFITDGASIPKFAWPIVGHPLQKYAQAAVVHDYLYHTQTSKRKRADVIFHEAMGVLKVANWKRTIMYQAVRRFGWIPWNKRAKILKANAKKVS